MWIISLQGGGGSWRAAPAFLAQRIRHAQIQHFKRTVNSGFPRYALYLDAHFLAEMCAGILVAVADDDRFEGDLTLDVAAAGEVCLGLVQRCFAAKEGEIVLRDEKDIVCVLCQGADEKTRVHPDTRNVLFYAYAVPGIESSHLTQGLSLAAEAVVTFGGGQLEELKVFPTNPAEKK